MNSNYNDDNHIDVVVPNDIWSNTYSPLLRALAKRKDPTVTQWRTTVGNKKFIAKCHICGQVSQDIPISTREIREHGLLHLKEYNLLPLI